MVWIPPREEKPTVPIRKIWENVKPGECFKHPGPNSDLSGIIFRKTAEGNYELADYIRVWFENPLPEIAPNQEVEVVADPATS